jgi:HPt (histidine-containing phosphotransfer) domain-containing protein
MQNETIDDEQLRVLAEAAGKEAVMPILDAFWVSNDELSDQLGQALSARDTDAVAKAAHALKGSSSNLGAVGVSGIARDIELAAKADDLDGARAAYNRLPDAFASARAAFTRLLDDLG